MQVGRGQPGTGHGGFKIVGLLLLGLIGTGRGGVKIARVLLRGRATQLVYDKKRIVKTLTV